MKSKFLCLVLALVPAAWAQAPPAVPPAKIIIHAGHMLDVKSGKMLGESAIVIVGDKIDGHGPWLPETVDGQHADWAAMGKVIDLSHATILPGLIDCHTHLTYDPNFGYQQLGISE